MSETNAQTKTSDQGLLAAGFFVGLAPLYYAKVNSDGALREAAATLGYGWSAVVCHLSVVGEFATRPGVSSCVD